MYDLVQKCNNALKHKLEMLVQQKSKMYGLCMWEKLYKPTFSNMQ